MEVVFWSAVGPNRSCFPYERHRGQHKHFERRLPITSARFRNGNFASKPTVLTLIQCSSDWFFIIQYLYFFIMFHHKSIHFRSRLTKSPTKSAFQHSLYSHSFSIIAQHSFWYYFDSFLMWNHSTDHLSIMFPPFLNPFLHFGRTWLICYLLMCMLKFQTSPTLPSQKVQHEFRISMDWCEL